MISQDLVIVGAGVAGSAVALACAGKGLKTVVLHREDERGGNETVSREVCKQLSDFLPETGVPFSEIIAWWGSEVASRQACPGAQVVNRLRLAQRMRVSAMKHTSILPIKLVLDISRSSGKWTVSYLDDSGNVTAIETKLLCDATGRRSVIASRLGGLRKNRDNLCCASITVQGSFETGTFTESVSDGWWNLCTDGTEGTLAFYSSPSLLRLAKQDMNAKLQRTVHLKKFVSVNLSNKVTINLCNSTRLTPCIGPDWIAVGDAAMTVQPLASAGVAKALRDASLAIRSMLGNNSEYSERIRFEFDEYLAALSNQYRLEARWPVSDFWKQYTPAC